MREAEKRKKELTVCAPTHTHTHTLHTAGQQRERERALSTSSGRHCLDYSCSFAQFPPPSLSLSLFVYRRHTCILPSSVPPASLQRDGQLTSLLLVGSDLIVSALRYVAHPWHGLIVGLVRYLYIPHLKARRREVRNLELDLHRRFGHRRGVTTAHTR